MSKKDMTTGEEFENFMSFAINYKVKPKKPSIKQVVNRVRKELEEIAKEWCRQGGRYDDELFVNLIAPLYRPAPKWKIVWNEEFKQHIAILNNQ